MSIKNSALKREMEEEEFYITQYWILQNHNNENCMGRVEEQTDQQNRLKSS